MKCGTFLAFKLGRQVMQAYWKINLDKEGRKRIRVEIITRWAMSLTRRCFILNILINQYNN
jgi:hypothetical protein